MSGRPSPRAALETAMHALGLFPRGERFARVSLWTMYYFSALIVPAVSDAARTGRIPRMAMDALVCDVDPGGHVVGFVSRGDDALPEGGSLHGLVDDHVAIVIDACERLTGFPARVGWSNAGVVLDYAVGEARSDGPSHAAPLHEAEGLLSGSGHPLLASPYRNECKRERRVCCLRYLMPGASLCPGICPRASRHRG